MRTIRRYRTAVGWGVLVGLALLVGEPFAFSSHSAPFVVMLLLVVGAVVFVGLWVARLTGRARAGALAGAIAFGIGNFFFSLLLAFALAWSVERNPSNTLTQFESLKGMTIVVLSPFVPALLGAGLGALGGLVGRRMYHSPASQLATTPPLEPGVPAGYGSPTDVYGYPAPPAEPPDMYASRPPSSPFSHSKPPPV